MMLGKNSAYFCTYHSHLKLMCPRFTYYNTDFDSFIKKTVVSKKTRKNMCTHDFNIDRDQRETAVYYCNFDWRSKNDFFISFWLNSDFVTTYCPIIWKIIEVKDEIHRRDSMKNNPKKDLSSKINKNRTTLEHR